MSRVKHLHETCAAKQETDCCSRPLAHGGACWRPASNGVFAPRLGWRCAEAGDVARTSLQTFKSRTPRCTASHTAARDSLPHVTCDGPPRVHAVVSQQRDGVSRRCGVINHEVQPSCVGWTDMGVSVGQPLLAAPPFARGEEFCQGREQMVAKCVRQPASWVGPAAASLENELYVHGVMRLNPFATATGCCGFPFSSAFLV